MNKSSRNSRLAKNTIVLGIGQFIPKLLSIIVLPLLTNGLSTDDFGIYDLVISLASLSLPAMSLMVQQGAFRYLITTQDDKEKKSIITTSITFVILLITLWSIVLVPVLWLRFGDVSWLIVLLYSSEVIYDVIGQISRGLGKNTYYSVGVVVYSILNMSLLVVFTKINLFNLENVLLSSSIAYIIGFIILVLLSQIKNYYSFSNYSKDNLKSLLKYSFPIIPSSISLWIVNLSDRLIIISVLGKSVNGIYGAANKIPNLVGSAYAVFNLAWTESATRAVNDSDKEAYYSNLYHVLFDFLTSIVLLIITFSPLLYMFLINEKFHEGYNQMPILCLGILFSCLVSFYGGIYVAIQKTKEVGISSLIGAIINLAINAIFINYIGIFAASLSTFISYLLIYIYRMINLKKHIKLNYSLVQHLRNFSLVAISVFLFYLNNNISFIFLCIITLISFIFVSKPVYELIKRRTSHV